MSEPVFARALGGDFVRMPAAVREVHSPAPASECSGRVDIDGAVGPFANLVARLFGFPGFRVDAEAHVRIERSGAAEIWTRDFGGARFTSRVSIGREPGKLVERFGPLAFDLAITANETGFSLALIGWRVFGVPAPLRLAPSSRALAFERDDGTYGFDVEITLPGGARLVRYRGWLRLQRQTL